jgi:hypothetical protein
MTRLLHNSVCGILLGFGLCLSGPGRASGNSVPAPTIPHKPPRYYLKSYEIVDENGVSHPADQRATYKFKETLEESWLEKDRMLERNPGDCSEEKPCDGISLVEQKKDDRRQLTALLEPIPANTPLPHLAAENSASESSDRQNTERSLFSLESYKLHAHDKTHLQ